MILSLAAALWILALAAAALRSLPPPKTRNLAHLLHYSVESNAVRDLLAMGTLGLGTGLFFWRLLAGQVWMPAGGGDLAQFLYPTYSFAAEWWRRGFVPLWNPYLFGGAPFVGDIQSGIFYPINLLTFFISVPLTFRDMELLSVLHFLVAGTGMYAFLRWGKLGTETQSEHPTQQPASSTGAVVKSDWALSRLACLGGAAAFEFSDLFITHFGNLNLIAVAAWMPLVLLFYRRAVTDRRTAFALVAGVILAVAFFAGHIQSFLFIVIALACWTLYEMATSGSRWMPVRMLVVTGIIAFGLSAPVLLPSLEMAQNTVRAAFPYEQAAQFSLPPAQLVGLFVPGFFGRGAQNSWAPWDRVEVGYIGILPLLLALLALVLRRDRLVRFSGLLALLGLALALGGYAVLHGWLYQFAPGLGQLRAPARFVFLFDFGVAVLAAVGFDALVHSLPASAEDILGKIGRSAPWAFLLVALTAGGMALTILILGQGQDPVLYARMAKAVNALAFFILLLALAMGLIVARATRFFHSGAWGVLALALIFFDLFSLGANVDTSTENPARVFEHPDAVAFLKSDGDIYRVDPRGTGVDSTWTADTAIVHGLFSIDGDNPLVLTAFNRYWESYGSRSSALYDLLNVKYLIGRKGVLLDRAKFRPAFDGDPAVDIFENTRVLPRAFIVSASQSVPNSDAALAAILAPGFDPARTVVLESGSGAAFPQGIAAQTGGAASVKIVGYSPDEIDLETSSTGAGWVVLSEVYYPGWRGWVDDNEVNVLRADYAFRAIQLPQGNHRVRLVFDPLSFKIGVVLFGGLVLACAGWGAWRWATR